MVTIFLKIRLSINKIAIYIQISAKADYKKNR